MRAILALVAGSIVGSVLIIAGFLIPEIIDALNGDKIAIAQLHALPYGVIVFVFVYAIFTAGIVLIGLPIWALMHQLGRRKCAGSYDQRPRILSASVGSAAKASITASLARDGAKFANSMGSVVRVAARFKLQPATLALNERSRSFRIRY